jgi:5-methylcytosine-specific restriction endonuclease McrA
LLIQNLCGYLFMRLESIRKKLGRTYRISNRTSTLRNAFAQAIAPSDIYDRNRIRNAIRDLKQDPDKELRCVFCGRSASSWDHLYPVVKDGEFYGYGNWLGNLVPCCTNCNSRKSGHTWSEFLKSSDPNNFQAKERILKKYYRKYGRPRITPSKITRLSGKDIRHLKRLREAIFERIKVADRVASVIHKKLQKRQRN